MYHIEPREYGRWELLYYPPGVHAMEGATCVAAGSFKVMKILKKLFEEV